MKKVLFLLLIFAVIGCKKQAHITTEDKNATRECTDSILTQMPGWAVADSSWWSHVERYKEVDHHIAHLHIIAVKDNDTLYIETSSTYGRSYVDGIIRYPHTYNSKKSYIDKMNNVIADVFMSNPYITLDTLQDGTITAKYLRDK